MFPFQQYSYLDSATPKIDTISAVAIQASDRIGGTHKNLDIRENPPDSSVESNLKSQI
jgi:hypothetical protein